MSDSSLSTGFSYADYFTLTAIIVSTCLLVFFWFQRKYRNAAAWTKVYVSAVMPLNYLLALLLQETSAAVLDNGVNVRVLRYWGWLATCPVLLLDIFSAMPLRKADQDPVQALAAIILDQLMVVCGVSAIIYGGTAKIVLFTLGCVIGLLVFRLILIAFLKAYAHYPDEAKPWLLATALIFSGGWMLFPIGWVLGAEGFGVIPADISDEFSEAYHAVADLIAKCSYSFIAWYTRHVVLSRILAAKRAEKEAAAAAAAAKEESAIAASGTGANSEGGPDKSVASKSDALTTPAAAIKALHATPQGAQDAILRIARALRTFGPDSAIVRHAVSGACDAASAGVAAAAPAIAQSLLGAARRARQRRVLRFLLVDPDPLIHAAVTSRLSALAKQDVQTGVSADASMAAQALLESSSAQADPHALLEAIAEGTGKMLGDQSVFDGAAPALEAIATAAGLCGIEVEVESVFRLDDVPLVFARGDAHFDCVMASSSTLHELSQLPTAEAHRCGLCVHDTSALKDKLTALTLARGTAAASLAAAAKASSRSASARRARPGDEDLGPVSTADFRGALGAGREGVELMRIEARRLHEEDALGLAIKTRTVKDSAPHGEAEDGASRSEKSRTAVKQSSPLRQVSGAGSVPRTGGRGMQAVGTTSPEGRRQLGGQMGAKASPETTTPLPHSHSGDEDEDADARDGAEGLNGRDDYDDGSASDRSSRSHNDGFDGFDATTPSNRQDRRRRGSQGDGKPKRRLSLTQAATTVADAADARGSPLTGIVAASKAARRITSPSMAAMVATHVHPTQRLFGLLPVVVLDTAMAGVDIIEQTGAVAGRTTGPMAASPLRPDRPKSPAEQDRELLRGLGADLLLRGFDNPAHWRQVLHRVAREAAARGQAQVVGSPVNPRRRLDTGAGEVEGSSQDDFDDRIGHATSRRSRSTGGRNRRGSGGSGRRTPRSASRAGRDRRSSDVAPASPAVVESMLALLRPSESVAAARKASVRRYVEAIRALARAMASSAVGAASRSAARASLAGALSAGGLAYLYRDSQASETARDTRVVEGEEGSYEGTAAVLPQLALFLDDEAGGEGGADGAGGQSRLVTTEAVEWRRHANRQRSSRLRRPRSNDFSDEAFLARESRGDADGHISMNRHGRIIKRRDSAVMTMHGAFFGNIGEDEGADELWEPTVTSPLARSPSPQSRYGQPQHYGQHADHTAVQMSSSPARYGSPLPQGSPQSGAVNPMHGGYTPHTGTTPLKGGVPHDDGRAQRSHGVDGSAMAKDRGLDAYGPRGRSGSGGGRRGERGRAGRSRSKGRERGGGRLHGDGSRRR